MVCECCVGDGVQDWIADYTASLSAERSVTTSQLAASERGRCVPSSHVESPYNADVI